MVKDTKTEEYAQRLIREQNPLWKTVLNVQAPYRWNLRHLKPRRTLDVGCGIGRNLRLLDQGSVGIDHNEFAVSICRHHGYMAYTPAEFIERYAAGEAAFDALLFSHVLEHMTMQEARECVTAYVPFLKPAARIILITPQEAGFASDSSHVEFMPFEKLLEIAASCGFRASNAYSFPFPRWLGRIFPYNEFVVVGERRE